MLLAGPSENVAPASVRGEIEMKIGIGLPSTIPWADARDLLDWAREAEAAGFSTLATIDRVAYGNYETIPTLAGASAVTERIGLATTILLTPFRGNGVLLAKQLATIDALSGGRLTVGIAVGGREDDYTATGVNFHARGRIQDEQLAEMRAVWAGELRGTAGAIGPRPVQQEGPPLLMGGTSNAAIRRAVEYGVGWISGLGGPDMFTTIAEKVRAAWRDAGRAGEPRLVHLEYYALGTKAEEDAHRYLTDYYAFLGNLAEHIAAGALTHPDQVREAADACADAGYDELMLFPCSPAVQEVALLADVVLRP
jgi:alkanesulfonate monooxygenase SsuD/methylene tetrahydromethanopterin reductase-like flavin-dependent oxidoreductase (luciferase family)